MKRVIIAQQCVLEHYIHYNLTDGYMNPTYIYLFCGHQAVGMLVCLYDDVLGFVYLCVFAKKVQQ